MSDLTATVEETKYGFHVAGYEKIEYDFTFLDGVFDKQNSNLAECYQRWGRCLAVMDMNIFNVYGDQMQAYFDHHKLDLKIHKTMIGEKAKFACAAYRRNTNYIRIPTTVIGLIDASVSIKVAVNYGNYKNRLGAYHAPMHTFLDFTFLRTLPEAQIRNGFAELIKISTCAHLDTFNLLDKYCEQLIKTGFGRTDDAPEEVREAAEKICRAGIHEMLKLETPNLHEIGLDRVIAYGHTWSPLHELTPDVPLRHGHAISIDMAYSATLANMRGLLSDEEHKRILNLFSRAGLSMDHHQFDEDMLDKATAAILKTRDGKLRAAVPSPLGSCVFINDVSAEDMNAALRKHKEIMKQYPRNGEGLEAFVDSSDTGYTMNNKPVEGKQSNGVNGAMKKSVINDDTNGGPVTNGGHANGTTGKHSNATSHASGPEGVDGLQNPVTNGANGHVNGQTNGHANGSS
ncbi:hypothetical protein LTR04_003154 [Oleoguttula sp. CCFEE 6159]|nr:hypothetical protein LTR04_003154 [Oleoguttula sp. CCFEE 6159]